MKKTFAFFMLLNSAALPAFCASTCETRVDAHQEATTLERAAYCLTPEAEPAVLEAGSELVYYSVSDKAPEKQPQQDARYKQKYFDKDGVAVAQDYVGTKNFPAFVNTTLSEQERLAWEQAQKEALEKAQAEAEKKAAEKREAEKKTAEKQVPLLAPSVLTEVEPEMSMAQLAARQNKPKRFMKAPVQEAQPESVPAEQAPTTPASEIQQAQALENDPLTSSFGNAGGVAPDGFLDDNLLDDPSFGYNATDPAMMP